MERINKELGTDYKIYLSSSTEQELIELFTSMSMEEFREYIKGIHEVDVEGMEKEIEESDSIDLQNLTYSQSVYYDGNNGFKVRTDVVTTANGEKTYEDWLSYGCMMDHYPYFDPSINTTIWFSSNRKAMTCKFGCAKVIGKGIIDNVMYTITCKFNVDNVRGAIM